MLVAVDLVIEMVENGLHRGGELHVEIEEIDRKGHREKREAYPAAAGDRHYFNTCSSKRNILMSVF